MGNTLQASNKVELIMVTTNNNNKFYRMEDLGDGTFKATYGRVGNEGQVAIYPISKWKTKYNEKINKGYKDVTALHAVNIPNDKDGSQYKPITNKSVAAIVDELRMCAHNAVRANYLVSAGTVTDQMVRQAQNQLNILANTTDVRQFNDGLLVLFETIPRRMENENSYLAGTPDQFWIILKREQDLLDTMAVQAKDITEEKVPDVSNKTILSANGLTMKPATKEDIEHIKKLLGHSADQFQAAWQVRNRKTQARFDKFIKSNQIETVQLWHGSRSENWWSIINTGLVLRPTNAIINGKMFGNGIYFANSAKKSMGYTSMSGSYWAGGKSSHGFLAIFEVAYGKPFDIYTWEPMDSKLDATYLHNLDPDANCVHAHKGKSLRNDEIIIYNEAQATIKYLVQIG